MTEINLIECLKFINPALLDYQDWVNIGMALKHEGYSVAVWEEWSRADSRFHEGECEKKWATFNGSASPVTAGTIVQMAKDNGWQAFNDESYALDWDSEIGGGKDDLRIIDKGWLEGTDIHIPDEWQPAKQIITYINTLFESAETVGFVTKCWQNEGKFMPTKGTYTMTAGEIVEKLSKNGDDIGAALGDYNPEAGAWVRFNPLDGKGVKNENVTDYRFALVESDTMDISKQNTILRELELPIACLVYSGGKSLHAIVRVDAANFDEYRKRVDFLYDVCKKNGLEIDRQNKNPSRLSRLPGVMRNGQKQYLLETNIGKQSWNEWKEWIEGINDDLPDFENYADVSDNLPQLAPELIKGILRQGHKMLLAGPPKAGKSFALIELAAAIASGTEWFGFQCAKGKVLYVNFEIDRPSYLHRIDSVCKAMNIPKSDFQNIDFWSLRGQSVPMDKLTPKLIRRALKKNYMAIIIDPIYKVITGDENSAEEMAKFCNQFDKIAHDLNCAVIYCHHHSKGAQGGKQSMDRASGSGVFARDPDALVDMLELPISEPLRSEEKNKAVCDLCVKWLERFQKSDLYSQDDAQNDTRMLDLAQRELPVDAFRYLFQEVQTVRSVIERRTAWRLEGTLREFPGFLPINLWYEYPVHRIDDTGVLGDIDINPEKTRYQKKTKSFKKQPQPPKPVKAEIDPKDKRKKALESAFDAAKAESNGENALSIGLVLKHFKFSKNTLKTYIDEHPDFLRDENGMVSRCQKKLI